MKYLVPVARASVENAERMAAAFIKHRCTTRQAGQLYAAWRADLVGAVFEDANLEGADLDRVNARNANFREANLEYASMISGNFAGADFTGARLRNASLSRARLPAADLSNARGLSQEQLASACGDDATQLPRGLTIPQCTLD
jgi:uncharacterized protein YjbI with pentapeptide repeats